MGTGLRTGNARPLCALAGYHSHASGNPGGWGRTAVNTSYPQILVCGENPCAFGGCPPVTLSLQPLAMRAAVEVTKQSKPSARPYRKSPDCHRRECALSQVLFNWAEATCA